VQAAKSEPFRSQTNRKHCNGYFGSWAVVRGCGLESKADRYAYDA